MYRSLRGVQRILESAVAFAQQYRNSETARTRVVAYDDVGYSIVVEIAGADEIAVKLRGLVVHHEAVL